MLHTTPYTHKHKWPKHPRIRTQLYSFLQHPSPTGTFLDCTSVWPCWRGMFQSNMRVQKNPDMFRIYLFTPFISFSPRAVIFISHRPLIAHDRMMFLIERVIPDAAWYSFLFLFLVCYTRQNSNRRRQCCMQRHSLDHDPRFSPPPPVTLSARCFFHVHSIPITVG
ncbi:hypothetical protein BGY98DRAFT_395229 [Russula aff. rugulosa BPL654]|nr:hypothetical protein BGY98DRAFT_395229 [Russula aff. rugulosa BPL654]